MEKLGWNPSRKRLLVHISTASSDDFGRQYTTFTAPTARDWRTTTPRCFSTDKNKEEEEEEETKQTPPSEEERNRRFYAHWIHELQSPPNVITTARILCTPVLSYWIIAGHHELALGGCFLAGASDWLDGYLAKNYDMSTVLGAYLDPFADKVLINTLSASLWYTGVLPGPLVALWFGRDIVLMVGSAYYVRSLSQDNTHAFDPTATPLKVNPSNVSKANTVLQFLTLGIGIVYPLYDIPPEVLSGFCSLTGFTTVASGLSYARMDAFSDSFNEAEGGDQKKAAKGDEKK